VSKSRTLTCRQAIPARVKTGAKMKRKKRRRR
jgi:hypothetical protein